MKVAAVQMTSGVEVEPNLAQARMLLEQAAAQGAKLAVLPENFAIMARRERDRRAVAEEDGEGPIQRMLASSAALSQRPVMQPSYRSGSVLMSMAT